MTADEWCDQQDQQRELGRQKEQIDALQSGNATLTEALEEVKRQLRNVQERNLALEAAIEKCGSLKGLEILLPMNGHGWRIWDISSGYRRFLTEAETAHEALLKAAAAIDADLMALAVPPSSGVQDV